MKQRLHKSVIFFFQWMVFAVIAGWAGFCHAEGMFTFQDTEKPKPEFTRNNDVISAKLIPRAKSNSVTINFAAISGGKLTAVKGVDFFDIDRPEVDVKNFKSAAFEIRVDKVAKGGEAKVSISSDFISSSTAFYIFNPKLPQPWIKDKFVNLPAKEPRVRDLQVTVKDGGPLDADGAADGKITLIGGPRDSFWGYALGTLFIRFFGIFIVLGVLMVGMMVSGYFFRHQDRRDPKKPAGKTAAGPAKQLSSEATDEEAAAIALALHLHFNSRRTLPIAENGSAPAGGGWAEEGRTRIMSDRLMVFNRLR